MWLPGQLRDKGEKRYSGVLMAVSSLPSPYGIGSFGKEAYEFVDFLCAARQRFWQILPLCPLGEGNSPYKSSSSFAGEMLYIDIDFLIRDRFIDKRDLQGVDFGDKVDYTAVRKFKIPLLKKAAQNFDKSDKNYQSFCRENAFWLDDYALFETAFEVFGAKSLPELPDGFKYHLPDFLNEFK